MNVPLMTLDLLSTEAVDAVQRRLLLIRHNLHPVHSPLSLRSRQSPVLNILVSNRAVMLSMKKPSLMEARSRQLLLMVRFELKLKLCLIAPNHLTISGFPTLKL